MQKFRIRDSVVTQSDDDLFIVYDAETGAILELNETAFSIVTFCSEERSFDDLCSMLKLRFSNTQKDNQIQLDLADVMKMLVSNRILSAYP